MDYLDLQMLAGAALGLTEDQTEDIIDDNEDFDTPLLEKFGVDLEQFGKIAWALLHLTPTVQSPLSGKVSHAFVRQMGNGHFLAIAQVLADEQPNNENLTVKK
ncbi:hypothetical protein P0F29_003290 [Vibrio metschnikovii]|nr:hypothetical protein [Vibrio metschnikovii]